MDEFDDIIAECGAGLDTDSDTDTLARLARDLETDPDAVTELRTFDALYPTN